MTQDVLDQLGTYLDNPIVFILVLATLAYLFVSKRLAEISGPIGALSRWWNGRQVTKVRRQRDLWQAQNDAGRQREDAELRQLRQDVDYLGRELTNMRQRERLRDDQARKHTAWDNDVVRKLQAANISVDAPPPPLYLNLSPLATPDEES